MFSKALFKQSCKANGMMWAIITFAVCFMLACVMLISGNGSIGRTKDAIQDTIIRQEIDAQIEKRAVSYYSHATYGLHTFDESFAKNATKTLTYHAYFTGWLAAKPEQGSDSEEVYNQKLAAWKAAMPVPETDGEKLYAKAYQDWTLAMPTDPSQLAEWMAKDPTKLNESGVNMTAVTCAYTVSVGELKTAMNERAASINPEYTPDSNQALEILATAMVVLNPNNAFDKYYTDFNETVPDSYDVASILYHISAGDAATYIKSAEREKYVCDRTEKNVGIFLSGNMTDEGNVQLILDNLAAFGVSPEKYNTFGYTYENIKHSAETTIITYRNRLDYETERINKNKANGVYATEEEYQAALKKAHDEIIEDVSDSLLESLPQEVSDALQEIGKMDLYTLIVGSIFYKLAGLLLPIIFMIMASNNLIAGQVDSGSMAYVLSTSTKRKTVAFTQALYLLSSLFVMFLLTTVTGCVCLAIVFKDVQLTYGKLILMNVGAFLVLVALSGFCFFTSCLFDRSKKSMALGGGLSIFALVAAMLGLFGSNVIPSVVRLDALNFFNFTTIISLFDIISIMDGTLAFVWKFVILLVLGIAGYILGSRIFIKKDLPL